MSSPMPVAGLGVVPVALAWHDIDTAGLSSKELMTEQSSLVAAMATF